MFYICVASYSFLEGENLSVKKKVINTIYSFQFGQDRIIIINDSYNLIKRSWGASSVSTSTNDGIRKIIFVEPAILKTSVDSIEPQYEYVKVGGYMGTTLRDSTQFKVNKNGTIEINPNKEI